MTPEQIQLAKKYAPAALAILIVVAGIWTWVGARQAGGSASGGFRVKCSRPDCGREFVIDRDDLRDYPRGPQGEGLLCKKCDRFSARIAVHCPRCGRWFIPDPSSPTAGCPQCFPPPPSRPARPEAPPTRPSPVP